MSECKKAKSKTQVEKLSKAHLMKVKTSQSVKASIR